MHSKPLAAKYEIEARQMSDSVQNVLNCFFPIGRELGLTDDEITEILMKAIGLPDIANRMIAIHRNRTGKPING